MDNIAKTAEAGDVGKALSPKTVENGVVTEWQFVEPGAGTDDYADLDNKPSIAGVTLSGNKTLEDLGIAADDDMDNLAGEVSDVKTAIHGVTTATQSDVGKYFKVKTVTDGTIAEVEFDNGGGSFSGTIQLSADNQTALLGEELASGTGWVLGTGWTGDFTNGFTHSSGTDALEYPIAGNEEGKMYLVQFKSTVDATIPNNFFVTIGDSDPFLIYGMPQPYQLGIVSKGTGNLKITPITSFTGKITEISIKEVTEISVPYIVTIDTNDDNAVEFRSGNQHVGNIFIGRNAGQWNVTGFGNVGIGEDALSSVIGGFWNTGIGKDSLKKNTTGSRNVGIGYGSLQSNLSGEKNIAIGTFALISNVTGKQNIAIGADSLDKNVSGYNNLAVGYQALYNVTSGYENIAFGNATGGQLTTGIRNIIIGQNTLGAIVDANYNIGLGYSVMPNTTGSYNVGLGMNVLYHNTGGQYNVAIGFQAGYGSNNASQTRNVFIGPQAGLNVYNSVNNNVLIGYQAGQTLVKGSENVCIGHGADVPASNTDNYTDINGQIKGSKATGAEWTQVLGNLIVMGQDGVKRQIVFNNDNTISWATVS